MHRIQRTFSLAVVLTALTLKGAAQTLPAVAAPDAGNLRAFFELAGTDLKARKPALIAQHLPLTAAEAAGFWPLQREYEQESARLGDQKRELVLRYAKNFETMTDREAAQLVKSGFDLEEKRTELMRKYFNKFQKVLPATKAARFFQIEHQISVVVDFGIAAQLPLIK